MIGKLSDMEQDTIALARHWLRMIAEGDYQTITIDVQTAQKIFASIVTLDARNGERVLYPLESETPVEFIARLTAHEGHIARVAVA